jgi:GAF domain-containing protein
MVAGALRVGHDAGTSLQSRIRSPSLLRLGLPALIVVMSVGGYIGAHRIVQSDRDAETARRVQVENLRAQAALGDARAYVAGFGNLLEGELRAGQRRFARLAGGAAGGVGLIDALWVQQVPRAARAAYERRLGGPITRVAGTRFVPAPDAAAYLPATFTTGTREELRRGVDVSSWAGLASAIQNRASVFAVGASLPAPLGSEPGLYLTQAASFGRGRDRRGVLAVFVPRGWLTAALDQDPRRVAINLDGRRLEGRLDGKTEATSSFDLLGRTWRLDVGEAPRTALQTALPWLALGWPPAIALLVFLVGRVILGRRRAERDVELLAREQAALRRVATLVARDASPAEMHDAVVEEARALLGSDAMRLLRYEDDDTAVVVADNSDPEVEIPVGTRVPLEGDNVSGIVQRTGRPVRQHGFQESAGLLAARAREMGIEVAVGAPVPGEGRLWGVMVAGWRRQIAVSAETESRMEQFTELVATAIANAESRSDLARLAEEQAALRRVATLVAREAPQGEVFTAIAEEIGQLLGTEGVRMLRFEQDGTAVVVASSGILKDVLSIGVAQPLGGENAASRVFRTGEPARMDEYGAATGPIAESLRPVGVHSIVATPIVVEGRLWGAMATVTTQDAPLPPETESRLGQFTELMGSAIGNIESHARAERLTEEQAALRRVATLVAEEAPPGEVFGRVVEELATVLGDADCSLFRDEGDGTATAVALAGATVSAGVEVGTRLPADGDGVIASVLREGRPCRIGDYSGITGAIGRRGRELGIRSAVGSPIVVRGRIWGVMAAARYEADAFPPETETRIAQFAELAATALANAAARTEIARLAEEQAALQRVATLVAQTASPSEVFEMVTREVGLLSGADVARMERYEPDGTVIGVAGWSRTAGVELAVGTRFPLEGTSIAALVRQTNTAARVDSFAQATGPIAQEARALGIRASVGCPIVVEHRLWGVIAASSKGEAPFPAGTESQIAEFTELVATAIANADSRNQLTASRARLLTAADEARRRVVRDLHDGAQQRLVHAIVTLRLAKQAFGDGNGNVESLVGEALDNAEQGNEELRELAHGILPAILTRGGLKAGVDAFVKRLTLPVQVDVSAERFPAEIESNAYFVVAEALTNVIKHAHAEHATVTARVEQRTLRVQVRDDGIGGARPDGSGLVGLADRVAVLDGRLRVESPADGGTLVAADIPVPSSSATL